jgi:Tfp pilus assembly protein PilO
MPLSPEDRDQIRNAGLICGLIVAALILAPGPDYGIGIGIMKLRESITRTEKLLAGERDKLEQEQLRIDRIPALEKELQTRAPEIQRYESRLPKSRNVPELFRDIDRFKQLSKLDISVQTRLDPVDKGDYLDLPIRIEAKGTYDSIATFINQLERNQRFAQVKELKIIEKPSEETSGGTLPDLAHHNATMKISTFMFNDRVVEEESKAKNAEEPELQQAPAAKPAGKKR